MKVARLSPNAPETGPAAVCGGGDQANKETCLTTPGKGCMWTRVETRDPSLAVQASNSYCLPCELDGEEIPCWSIGAFVGGRQVTDCIMSCQHQKRIMQPGYSCSAGGSGGLTASACFKRGTDSGSRCMYVAFTDKFGESKTRCGPCELPGSGSWGCPAPGELGPEDDSKVTFCNSQCDLPCPGPPDCPPTVAPPAVPPPGPGVVKTDAGWDEMVSAPNGAGMPTQNPYAIVQAAIEAAKAAGFPYTTLPPPRHFFPLVVYRTPADYLATTLPPMPDFVSMWPSSWADSGPAKFPSEEQPGVPPAALVQTAAVTPRRQTPLLGLQRKRRRRGA